MLHCVCSANPDEERKGRKINSGQQKGHLNLYHLSHLASPKSSPEPQHSASQLQFPKMPRGLARMINKMLCKFSKQDYF